MASVCKPSGHSATDPGTIELLTEEGAASSKEVSSHFSTFLLVVIYLFRQVSRFVFSHLPAPSALRCWRAYKHVPLWRRLRTRHTNSSRRRVARKENDGELSEVRLLERIMMNLVETSVGTSETMAVKNQRDCL